MVTLSRRHYELIASIIADLDDGAVRQAVAEHFAKRLKGTNPAYKPDRFFEAATKRR
jgi:hypothetical protein